jgi:hypothetical protein
MNSRYLEVTYRNGKPLAAYFYLPREAGDESERSERFPSGLVIDFAADGRTIGVEIPSPSSFTLSALNEALRAANLSEATPDDVAPLLNAPKRQSTAE